MESNRGSQFGAGGLVSPSDDLGDKADSVLGEANFDLLLKAVIKKAEYNAKRMDDLNSRMRTE